MLHGDELDTHASSLDVPFNQSTGPDLPRGQIKKQLKRGSRRGRVERSQINTAETKITDEGDEFPAAALPGRERSSRTGKTGIAANAVHNHTPATAEK